MGASHTVLKGGGILAGYSIHVRPTLSSRESIDARELGPSFVGGLEDPGYLAKTAGFVDTRVMDVTPHFRETCIAWIEAMEFFEEELRAELDQSDYRDELRNKKDMLCGIDKGLLMRSLIVCKKEG